MKITKFTVAFLLIILVFACQKDEFSSTSRKGPQLLEHDYNVTNDNARVTGISSVNINNDVAALGRVLFYDDILSTNGRKACGSCHIQSKGFGDGEALSNGFMDQKTDRHSMALVNLRTNSAFFWDGRAQLLEKQVLMPIGNHIEMGISDINELIYKMEAQPYYSELFEKAFGDNSISDERIGLALKEFVSVLVSSNTKFDKVQRNEAAFTVSEERGQELFNTTYRCVNCHTGGNFNSRWGGTDFTNIGLDINNDNDPGVQGRFKVPSLRNIAVTGPYMHDGRFATLDDVLNHYSSGIKENPSVDWRLRDGQGHVIKLNITPQDRKDLVAFLNTLTDQTLLTDIKYSNPF